MEYKDSTHTIEELDAAADAAVTHIANAGIHMTAAEKAKLTELENYDDSAIQARIKTLLPLGLGTLLTDPDPEHGVYADLFTLPVGKYYRTTNYASVQHLPTGFSGGFMCIVEAAISSSRKMITLYQVSGANATAEFFYKCLQTANGYGPWYKYTGEAVS
ncbi:MAG: hypothetical protein K6E36_10305 [Oscillospiraceae bacterium]|nr:hypothetical protein [Oscillospiraceae bacterium]MCR5306881.1 hypothetical protein [Oscillospiraceae bacterium]